MIARTDHVGNSSSHPLYAIHKVISLSTASLVQIVSKVSNVEDCIVNVLFLYLLC